MIQPRGDPESDTCPLNKKDQTRDVQQKKVIARSIFVIGAKQVSMSGMNRSIGKLYFSIGLARRMQRHRLSIRRDTSSHAGLPA
jgi:hypothetical protein